jgi:pyruvate/2-oxoglutarate dehydrogenase complex dihydrolipoamide dehydrogenase (E3) component
MTFEPVGTHDRRLLDNVRPDDWPTPEPQGRYDLVVIGGGTGGLVSTAIGAALGGRVALVERALMGGDCLNYGCVPSKGLLRAARSWGEARGSAARFHGPEVSGAGDFAGVMEQMRSIRADISDVDGAERFRSMGADIYFGEAKFTGPTSLTVAGTDLHFRRAIIATGGRAAVPPIEGLRDADYLTNETVFQLTELPSDLVVLGAGPIGAELSFAFATFGSRVTLLDMAERPLPREEPEASDVARKALEAAGVRFIGGARVRSVREDGGRTKVVGYEAGGRTEEVSGERLLVALGRAPNLDLDLDRADVEHDRRGVKTNDRLRTTNPKIYAVGDVAGRHQFTHVADAHARIAVRNALFLGRGSVADLVVPAATYLHPEIARVGPTRAELEQSGQGVETVRLDLDDVDRAKLDGETDGFLMIHVREGNDEILGATVVADHAGDLISQITQAMTQGKGLLKLGDMIYPYPTVASVIGRAADAHRRKKLTARTMRFFDFLFRVTRRLP